MDITTVNNDYAQPFLRWAGGKTWLLKHLKEIRNLHFNNYHEPFVGGGSIFFYLQHSNHSYLSDLNGELIETYRAVKEDAVGIIKTLKTLKNSETEYYKIRKKNYQTATQRAAKFIYLNQTSYNGIYRVNLKGIYNVPYGFRKKEFLDIDTLLNAQKCLAKTTIEQQDFSGIVKNIKSKDLVFLDPPYTVSHNNNGFIKYNEKIFSLDDQIRLSSIIDNIKKKGAYYILTNAAHNTIEQIFEKGDKKFIYQRASLIGGIDAKRGQINELVFTNTPLQ
jgi:DNA adenine methylase